MPIHQKINQVMLAVKGVTKNSRNKFADYDYAGHEAVTAALREHFAAAQIVRSVSMVSCDVLDGGLVKVCVDVTYTDAEDQSSLVCRMFALQHSQTKKGAGVTAQQVGQALSYAVKNVEFKTFALTGSGENDSDATRVDLDDDDDDRPSEASPESLKARAQELLQLVGRAENKKQLEEALEEARAEYSQLQSVPNFAESMRAMREGAEIKLGLRKAS